MLLRLADAVNMPYHMQDFVLDVQIVCLDLSNPLQLKQCFQCKGFHAICYKQHLERTTGVAR